MRFQLGEVYVLDGTIAVDVTAHLPLKIVKKTTIRLSADDAHKLVAKVQAKLAELGPGAQRRLT